MPDTAVDAVPRWSVGRVAAYAVLVTVVFGVVQTLILIALLSAHISTSGRASATEWLAGVASNGAYLSLAAVGGALIGVPLVRFLAARREPAPWAFLGLRSVPARTVVGWCVALLLFVVVTDAVTVALGREVVPPFMAAAFASAHPLLLLAALVVAAPLFEEVFFRGFVIGALEASRVSPLVAGTVAALLWAVVHLQYDVYGITTIFLLGLLLALARHRTRSILPCIAMHGAANALAFVETALVA
jgi:CAAX protease family protein